MKKTKTANLIMMAVIVLGAAAIGTNWDRPAMAQASTPLIAQAPASAAAANAGSRLQVNLNGSTITLQGKIVSGVSYMPLKVLGQALGLQVSWSQADHAVTVKGNGRTLVMKAGDMAYQLNGYRGYADDGLLVENGTSYLPLRFVGEQMGYNIGYDGQTKTVTVKRIDENALTWSNLTVDSEEKDHTTIDYQIPQITFTADQQVQTKINAFLKQKAEAILDGAKSQLQASRSEFSDEYKDTPMSSQLFYAITSNQDGRFSLILDEYYYSGGAHGGTAQYGYTFDLKTGSALTLQDLVGTDTDYLAKINKEASKQLEARYAPLLSPFNGITDESRFYVDGDNLVLFFDEYEYTPYAAGIPTVTIPLSAFK